jgi:hypothetical protein
MHGNVAIFTHDRPRRGNGAAFLTGHSLLKHSRP